MRVTYVLLLDLPSTRAHALQTVHTAAALAERGIEVHLHPRVEEGADAEEILAQHFGVARPPALHLHPIPRRAADLARASLALRLLPVLLRGDPDHVLLVRERRAALAVLALRRLTGRRTPLVFEFHGLDHVMADERAEQGGGPEPVSRRARRILRQERRIVREADGLLAVAEPLARDLERRLDLDTPPELVPSGVDVSAFRGCGRPRLDEDEVRVVYAGSLYPAKGVDTLVEAMGRLPDGFRLTVVGGNMPEDLERLRARARGLADGGSRITFTGQVRPSEVPRHLARADVLVIPAGPSAHSKRYTSPLKLFEALSTGVPLVVGPSAAFLSVVEPGRTAEVASNPGPEALARAVLRVVDDPDRALSMARRAMDVADERSWARRAERLEAALRSVLERRGGPGRSRSGAAG